MNTRKINTQLYPIYNRYFIELKLRTDTIGESFSCPILMKVFPDYLKVNRRIMFVGKETLGWYDTMNNSADLGVDELLKTYEEFEFGKEYHGRNSPFWRFIKTFHTKLNGEQYPNGFLWTNFSKCDSNRTTPSLELQEINNRGFELLRTEIEITKPQIVLFITGWSYDHHFERVFKEIQYDELIKNTLYLCKHPALPHHTFHTMHPKALQLRSKFNQVMDKIVELVSVTH